MLEIVKRLATVGLVEPPEVKQTVQTPMLLTGKRHIEDRRRPIHAFSVHRAEMHIDTADAAAKNSIECAFDQRFSCDRS